MRQGDSHGPIQNIQRVFIDMLFNTLIMNMVRIFFIFTALVSTFVFPSHSMAFNAADTEKRSSSNAYVLGDSIAFGLHLDGIEEKLQQKLGGVSRVSYDGGRSITTPGNQIGMTAFESIEADKEFISGSKYIIIILGMNPQEDYFDTRQQQLITRLKDIAPEAKYFWVDIGATISTHTKIWNARNKIIYDNAPLLGYSVISRYKAIFGSSADPFNITPGKNFPGWADEPGVGSPGNIHGYYPELTHAVLNAIANSETVSINPPSTAETQKPNLSAYVLGDSIAYGLYLDGLESKLKDSIGGVAHINYDGGRSITTPGSQIHKSALDSVEIDKDFISSADIIVVILGMNSYETSFEDSQRVLIEKLRTVAPKARIYWVDIGATLSTHVDIWNVRNKSIYANSEILHYTVISRYRSIFGPSGDPMNIRAGLNFPGWENEPGLDGPGNIHGYYPELSRAIIQAISVTTDKEVRPKRIRTPCAHTTPLSTYVLGDSIAFGLHKDRLALKMQVEFGGVTRISYDTGRSISTPGSQIRKSALESVELDKEYISKANVVIISLGTNQNEESFPDSQQQLMTKLKSIAPEAKYYWIDIGATISTQTSGWSARNKVIYEQAKSLGYSVISRYKAIFGPYADPLNITPGRNFPGMDTEPGYGGSGNIHGAYPALTEAILDAISQYFDCKGAD